MFKLEKPNTEVIESKMTELGSRAKELARKIGKRNLAIIASVLVIGGAIWLNVALFSKGAKQSGAIGADTDLQGEQLSVDGENNGNEVDAASEIDSYFASCQVDRKRSRDEAIQVLQLVVDNPSALDESKSQAMAEISQIAKDIDCEAKIENLVMAKGFSKCVAVINDKKCNVVVKTGGELLPNERAQILEIVYQQSNILPVDVKIIEKKAVA